MVKTGWHGAGFRFGMNPPAQIDSGRFVSSVAPTALDTATLLTHYYPLIERVVHSMLKALPTHADREELKSVGLTGLIRALDRYDPSRAQTFPAYACLRIRGAILDELRKQDVMPRSGRCKLRRLQDAIQRLEARHGRTPHDAEIAAELKLTASGLERLREKAQRSEVISLDASGPEDDNYLHETIADPTVAPVHSGLEHREQVSALTDQIGHLPERQQRVLAMYYNEGLRLIEIAEAFGVTEARISQIHSQALATLRRRMGAA